MDRMGQDTQKKIEMSKFIKQEETKSDVGLKERRRKSEKQQPTSKPHFKIDWRQLTYYQKSDSYSGRIFSKLRATFSNKTNQQSDRIGQANDGLSIYSGQTLASEASHFSESGSSQKSSSHKSYKPKRILNSLDGTFRSGQLSAILGPSGAGKSTFLSTLFGSKQEGSYGQTKVTWFVDSAEEAKSMSRRRLRTVFLPQHDHLLHHLTVYETLLFASKIKNKLNDCDKRQDGQEPECNFHRQNVKRVAKMLKLNDCLDTRCGRLSGGQYKRVSIAQELLSNPDVMILDEPTSGLDAMTCLTTILTLKSIVTKHPMSIILTIHQPDIDVFNIFDHIYVIAQGGLAIYEGPPHELAPTLASLDLNMPSTGYNPARFIVENAFLVPEAESDIIVPSIGSTVSKSSSSVLSSTSEALTSSSSSDDEDENEEQMEKKRHNYIKRSVLSLTEVISGKEMVSPKKDKKPLLNIGIRTLDGKLITSEQLARRNNSLQEEQYLTERWNLLSRLNQLQKAKYYSNPERQPALTISVDNGQQQEPSELSPCCSSGQSSISNNQPSSPKCELEDEGKSSKSDYSSAAGWSEVRAHHQPAGASTGSSRSTSRNSSKAVSLAQLSSQSSNKGKDMNRSLQNLTETKHMACCESSESEEEEEQEQEQEQFVLELGELNNRSTSVTGNESVACSLLRPKKVHLRRQFDKRLSSRHNSSKYRDYPIWYHSFVLTHRTWLSIIRDPIFFGIQAVMHTTIPILLSLIFGSNQEEGCPQIGNFDLVEFAYSDSNNMIQGTVRSIRQSIGNIGIVFFEMFVLSFSINCITALVFPLDMHVLLKEYRNGWYSLRSYFIGRTLADLPVPIVLHSIGMSILYYLTGQPSSLWRYSAIIVLVIISSLVAQSVGLTIGALLMESSQSAVLAAAGIVAPFFALSGFIVRIHTLPVVAQIGAKLSYLYHLLNGFIIVRYGFGRCQCSEEDFDTNEAHQIPSNLHTMASMWIGTYSNEFTDSSAIMKSAQLGQQNKTNIDPNIDVVDKMMTAFKMANSYGHKIENCSDVLPYAMLDFNLRESDVFTSFLVLVIMLIVSRLITFSAIYYKIRSFA